MLPLPETAVGNLRLWSYLGVPATLIIIEVIPFLVLADDDDDDDEDDGNGGFGNGENMANDADDMVDESVASSGGVGGCVGGKVKKERRGQ
ncbi:unnamed protein product [Taenia asiatica]|uniref:Uncharacterized protein n=1 Tax=Taenia asiatica TaxID=60517 RepID=A0A0R3WFQ2_TAEAS|nr:unnamed protein product [Taenia asiatica]